MHRRYYESQPPRCAPDACTLDGLDGLLLDGHEVAAGQLLSSSERARRQRSRTREAAAQARGKQEQRERVLAALRD